MTARRIAVTAASAALFAVTNPAGAQDQAQPPSAGAAVTLDQLSTSSAARPARQQVRDDLDLAQPATPSRNATATITAIPTTADARDVQTGPVLGSDRCDPARGHARTELCRRRVETRAGDYARPAPAPVTSEGRLLLLVNPGTPEGRQPSIVAGLNNPNGPAEQIAGALQGQAGTEPPSTGNGVTVTTPAGSLPSGVPPIVVLTK